MSLNIRMIAKLSEILHQIVADFGAGLRFTDDKTSISQITPGQFYLVGKLVVRCHCHIDTLVPQMGDFTSIRERNARQKSNIQSMVSHSRDMFRGFTLCVINMHVPVLSRIHIHQVCDKTRRH